MKKIYIIILLIFVLKSSLNAQGDGWNDRTITSCNCEQGEEVARVSLTFIPPFDTDGCNDFIGYIDPDLPPNGGTPVSDGEFNMNYIRVYTPLKNNTTNITPVHGQIDYDQWSESITYFDGLGKEIQKVDVKASAEGFDIIQPIIYDDFGRLKQEHLAYTINQVSNDGPGGYRVLAENEQNGFYQVYFEDDADYAFSNKEFDGSPLDKVMKQAAPGQAWDLDNGAITEFKYESNQAGEVMLFEVNSNDELVKSGYYITHELYRNATIDENGNTITEYTNFQEQVILKKGEENTKTYYVYDDFGLLRYVLPPNASALFDGGNIPTAEELEPLIYYYQYDERKRMIAKKLPGVEAVYMVYNNRDQLVLTQDGNQGENNEWTFTKYDVFNRPIITGIYVAGGSPGSLQTAVDSDDDYYEEFDGSTTYGYSNQAFPSITNSDMIYTIQYYDNYDALPIYNDANDTYGFKQNEAMFLHLEDNHESAHVKGLPIITWTKVLTGGEDIADDELVSVTYYNIYNQPIQIISDNHLGGYDIVSSRVNFTGDVEATTEKHVVDGDETEIKQWFTYDHAKRLLNITHQVNGLAPIQLVTNKYNELGQLKRKKLHGWLKEITHSYNIRGWLSGINDIDNFEEEDLFAMKLDYNSANHPQYNGNIGGMSWTSSQFSDIKAYDFVYDGLNRLDTADYVNGGSYSSSYSYDANGNIGTLNRSMDINGVAEPIDQLVYEYTGNQLKKVDDAIGTYYEGHGFKDNGIQLAVEYAYDANGNMILDKNKGIDAITYNSMNLPTNIVFNENEAEEKSIGYIYTADGIKLQKHTHINNNANSVTTDYIGAFVYETTNAGPELQFIQTSEGRLVPDGNGGFNYEYAIKDHLGNTRVMFDETGQVLQDQGYYPFGMSMGEELTFHMPSSLPDNKYLYNGKELQDDFGLGWYDYGARFYDAQLGRWHVVDPLGEEYFSFSSYNYTLNNSINFIDPDGRWVKGAGFWNNIFKSDSRIHAEQIANEANIESRDQSNTNKYKAAKIDGKWGVISSSNLWTQLGNVKSKYVSFTPVGKNGVLGSTSGSFIYASTIATGGRLEYPPLDPIDLLTGAVAAKFGMFAARYSTSVFAKSVTTADGFLFKGFTIKTPFNISVQRFGNMSLKRPDYWGVRIGTSQFANRTFAAIKPSWNPLTQYTKGVIPKGTPVKFGIVGPQGWRHPGGSIQFIINSKSVINQSSKLIQ